MTDNDKAGEAHELPSRGRWFWREEFYSVYSSTVQSDADVNHEHGVWHNVWLSKIDGVVYVCCYPLWHWWHNRANSRSRRELERMFPKLKG